MFPPEIDMQLDLAAGSRLNVLLLGESGVGKDVAAAAIHSRSSRADRAIMRVSPSALGEEQLTLELLHALIEGANGGTVVFDEVGALSPVAQLRLVDLIEDSRRPDDVRFLFTSSGDLRGKMRDGSFRAELFYRMSVVSIALPPLRDRKDDILPLAMSFLEAALARENIIGVPELLRASQTVLLHHDWPGNVRELRNTIEHAVLFARDSRIGREHLPPSLTILAPILSAVKNEVSGADSELARIRGALEQCGGNQSRAAELLGMSRTTLHARLDEYNFPRPKKRKAQ